MKNYKVKAIKNFRDSNEIDEKTGLKIDRTINDEFYCTKERYEFLKQNNAVKLVEIIEELKIIPKETKPIKIVETNAEDLSIDPYKDFEVKEEKPKTKRTTKKTSKK